MAKTSPEEYEVEAIKSHRIVNVGRKPTLQYLIKWKGYNNSDNTWEPSEATEHAQDLVQLYWDTKGGGHVAREKVEKTLRGESSEDESDNNDSDDGEDSESSGYEEDKAVRSSNRKRVSRPTTTRTSRKKAKTSNNKSKEQEKNKKEKTPEIEEESDTESDVSESEIEKGDFRARTNNWKTDVEKIISVRPNQDENNELYALVRWRDGKIGMNKTSVVAQKNPQILIKYYEKRLAFERKD